MACLSRAILELLIQWRPVADIEAIRRIDVDGTRAGNSQNNPAEVVRSVSAEAAFQFRRRHTD